MVRARTLSLYRLLRIFRFAAATMLLLLLLHLVIIHLLTARDVPPRKDAGYVIKHIDSCPDVGYYFRRDASPNTVEPGPCYLCFCQGDNTAVCWKRDNRRCNVESFHYHGVGKRDTRIRRSPGFADIFFRDATRDLFNKNGKTECKPFESSFSDDCPPVDWCIGCTVCDCDANGRWDCHVLSFCPDKKTTKKSKRKGPMRKIVNKKPTKGKKTTKATTTQTKKKLSAVKNSKSTKKFKAHSTPPILGGGDYKTAPHKHIVKKSVPVKPEPTFGPPRRAPIKFKRIPAVQPTNATKEIIIKKNIATHKPIEIQSSNVNLEMKIAQKLVKQVMGNLRKSINGEMLNMTKMASEITKKTSSKNIKKGKPKTKSSKKVNKKHFKKPQKKPLRKRYQKKTRKENNNQKKPSKKPVKNTSKKPLKKPVKKPTRKPPQKDLVRNKRDIIIVQDIETSTVVGLGNSTQISSSTIAYSVDPVNTNLLIPETENCTHNLVESNTLSENNQYYKYVVGAEDLESKLNRPKKNKEHTDINLTETVLNLIGTDMIPIKNIKKYNKPVKQSSTLKEFSLERNDLKYSKWSHLKLLKEKKLNSIFESHRNLVKIISPVNKSNVLKDNKKFHGRDIERKLNSRKYNLIKLLNHSKYKPNSIYNVNSTRVQMQSRKYSHLHTLLSKMLGDFYKRNMSSHKAYKKTKKFSVIRYLKRIFNKLFKRKSTPDKFSQHHILQTLCENFGPCKVNIKDKFLLKTKLAELDVETTKILRSVKIIKGLLKLVDLPEPRSIDYDASQREIIRNDIQKLNNILRGSYNKLSNGSLSETQLTQIEYIKANTQEFVQEVNKFTTLLNQIIYILTKRETDLSKNPNRFLRNSYNHRKNSKEDPFRSLKHLLLKYNLVQNSFMKKMYEQLNNFEGKINEKSKVSEVKDLNNTVEIENFSRNIIENLRKLKRLAQTLSYSGRTKRETMRDDDAIEYLLMLMEYLLKQNHPLDAAPVNDGIDLLIEAIKNAPDIKPIRKKVLEYTPATFVDSATTPSSLYSTTENSFSDDESHSDHEKNSSEDSGKQKLEETEDNLRTRLEENRELVEMIAEDDKGTEDLKYDRYDGKLAIEKPEEITEAAFYNRAQENVVEADNEIELTTPPPLDIEVSEKNDKEDMPDTLNLDRPAVLEDNNVDKPVAEETTDEKKFEVFTADMDEDAPPGTVLTSVSETPSTITTEITKQAKKSKTKMRHLNLESADSESIDKKSKLEWIEENFGRDKEKGLVVEVDESNGTVAITTTTKTTVVTKPTDKTDLSVLSHEGAEETDKKRKAKINAEDVMFRKQMDLLNSLDYGTEKAEFEESESKDGNAEERYSSDTFPSYFV